MNTDFQRGTDEIYEETAAEVLSRELQRDSRRYSAEFEK